MLTTLHTRRVSPKRLVLLLTSMQDVMTALPTPEEAEAQVNSLVFLPAPPPLSPSPLVL